MTSQAERIRPLQPERTYTMADLVHAMGEKVDAAGKIKIISALTMATTLHATERRESGAPFVQHPLAAALYLLSLGYSDVPTLVGTLTHDIPENTMAFGNPRAISHAQWMENICLGFSEGFDAQTADIVIALQRPKVNNIDVYTKEHADALFAAKLEDGPVEAVMAKLAERLHNARTLEYLSIAKQRLIVRETEKVLFPIFTRAIKAYPAEAKYLMDEMRKALAKAKSSWGELIAEIDRH